MPGKQVKSWAQYHRLRAKGLTKSAAARITNARARRTGRRGK